MADSFTLELCIFFTGGIVKQATISIKFGVFIDVLFYD